MQITIRQIGNSQGIVIPKPLLAQLGLQGTVEVTVEGEALVLRKPANTPRSGWDEAAKAIADEGDDVLVMGEFGNEDDQALTW
jgi:antitoxin MazE